MIGRVNTGSGGTGATLTIKAPAGCTVTVSKDGKTKTKVAGSDGIVVFKGLATGTWTVTITDGGQTSTKPVIITADYSTVIAFFSATIHVSYPSGSTCTATDGVTNLHAPDTSGTWVCVVPNAGTWTISCADGDSQTSAVVTISTDGEEKRVTLSYMLYLYNQGDTCDAVTGGWQARALGVNSSSDAHAPDVAVNEGTITLTAKYKYQTVSSGVYEIINNVDVSSFASISIEISSVAYLNKGAFFLVVFDRSISSWGSLDCANAKASVQINDAGTFSLDISSISGECAIGIMTRNNSSATGPSMEFSEVVLK